MKSSSAAKGSGIGPSVSIIIPAYNAQRYLAETVESVLAQSFGDFELLIVDDGSTDGTRLLASDLAQQDGRIRAIHAAHGGVAAARNTALEASRGEFLALLDSDDAWAPDYLARQLEIFDIYPDAAIVTANVVNLGGPFTGRPFWPTTSGLRRLALRHVIEREDAVCIMSVFRRAVYEAIGGFDPIFTSNEDYDFWLRAAHAGFVIVQNRAPLGHYRRHDTSMSANEPQMIQGILAVLRGAETLCADMPAEREAIRSQIQRFVMELPRAALRAALQRGDRLAAVHALEALSAQRGGWAWPAIARMSTLWPQPLLWAYCVRRAMR